MLMWCLGQVLRTYIRTYRFNMHACVRVYVCSVRGVCVCSLFSAHCIVHLLCNWQVLRWVWRRWLAGSRYQCMYHLLSWALFRVPGVFECCLCCGFYICTCTCTVVPCSRAYGNVAAVPSLLFLSCCLFRPTYTRTYMCMYVDINMTCSNCTVANRNSIFIISAWLGSVMIYYSCNHTSRESNGPMLRVKNSDVLAQSRALFSE